MMLAPGIAAGSEVIVEPQFGQNRRTTSWPLSPFCV
jgi:hypothetical protein